MNEAEKRVTINHDTYILFKSLLISEIENSPEGDQKKILKEIQWLVDSRSTFLEGVYQRIKKLQKNKKIEPFNLGVINYFLARIFAQRKEFNISLKLLKEASDLLKETEPLYAEALAKDISILKLANHYTEN